MIRKISHANFTKWIAAAAFLVDSGCNDYSATFAAAYTVRAGPGAAVSVPCTWEEVERGAVAPRSFTIRKMAERMENVGDLWSDLLQDKTIVTVADGAVGQDALTQSSKVSPLCGLKM